MKKILTRIKLDWSWGMEEVILDLGGIWSVRTVGKQVTKRSTVEHRKNAKHKGNVANAVTEKIHYTLLLSIGSLIDSWVLNSRASFHTIAHWEIMENHVFGNYGNVNLTYGKTLYIVSVGDIRLKISNGFVWKIHKVRHIPKFMCNLILMATWWWKT